jgi:hypothetical protein
MARAAYPSPGLFVCVYVALLVLVLQASKRSTDHSHFVQLLLKTWQMPQLLEPAWLTAVYHRTTMRDGWLAGGGVKPLQNGQCTANLI